jgi:hypothetical protein
MRIKTPIALAIAALLLTPCSLLFVQAAEAQAGPNAQSTGVASNATEEAARMVPANAIFLSSIDSQKLAVGTQVKVKLQSQVRLNNGSVLPGGTVLVGQVVEDTTQTGKAKLAVRFTEADLKKGQTVPIKVTIFNLFQAPSDTVNVGDTTIPPGWDKQALGVNHADVVPGIDLHSSIDNPNSGVFVSTKKSNIKLSSNYGVSLAIAPRSSSEQSASGY